MGKIGNLGKTIVFSVSDKKVLTFTNFTQTISGNWAQHALISRKPKSEFLGAKLRTIRFNILLSATHGVRPRKTMIELEKAVERGTVNKLVIGGKSVGNHSWKITEISEEWNTILSKGEIVESSVSISLEEYV